MQLHHRLKRLVRKMAEARASCCAPLTDEERLFVQNVKALDNGVYADMAAHRDRLLGIIASRMK